MSRPIIDPEDMATNPGNGWRSPDPEPRSYVYTVRLELHVDADIRPPSTAELVNELADALDHGLTLPGVSYSAIHIAPPAGGRIG